MDPRVPWRRTFRVRERHARAIYEQDHLVRLPSPVDCALEFGSD